MPESIDNSHPEVTLLIKDMAGPDYITYDFADINIPSLIVLSKVFRVDNSYLGSYLARVLSRNKELSKDKSILDLGCGSGLLGIVCALNGARSIYFSDINPQAVKNSRLNALLFDLDNVEFSEGNLFSNIPSQKKFDTVIFNPPSIPGVPSNHTEAAFYREDRVIQDFFSLFPNHLGPSGTVIMPGSSRFNSATSPLRMIKELRLNHRMINQEAEGDGSYKFVVTINP